MKITGITVRQPSSGPGGTSVVSVYLGISCSYFFHLENFFTVLSLGGFFVSKLENKRSGTVQHLRLALPIKVAEVGALIWAHPSAWSSRLANLTDGWAHDQSMMNQSVMGFLLDSTGFFSLRG